MKKSLLLLSLQVSKNLRCFRLLMLTLVLCGSMQAMAETETWTDSNGITWSFTVNGTEATDIRFSGGPNSDKIYLYGDPNREDKETQLPFQPGIYNSAAMRFSYSEGSHLPTIPDDVYFSLKTLIFDVSDVTDDFDLKVMNAWWSSTYYDHVKWEDGLNYLQITQKMAEECARGGQGKDLTLMLVSGSMTFKSVYYETISTPGTVVEIPEKVYVGSTELTVTSIGDYAFSGCSGLTSVTIPNSVTTIGDYAFNNCDGLTSIEIPNSVTSIGARAFGVCRSLTSITIPNSVTSIGDHAFNNCGLTSIEIPNSVTNIGAGTFVGCTSLSSIEIPNSVTSIGEWAFSECWSLTSIEIPNSVTSIGEGAFSGCYRLTSIEIPNSVTSISEKAFSACFNLISISVESGNTKYDSRDNCNAIIETASNTLIAGCQSTVIPNSVTSIGNSAFRLCGLTSIIIPNSVTSIGDGVFFGCGGLTSITIPNSVTSIGNGAFANCLNLTEFICYAVTPPACGDDAFEGIDKSLCTLYVPEPSIETYKATEPWSSFTKIVAITITPISEDEDISFSDEITEETDLSSVIIDNIYITVDTDNGDGYDSDEQALVLSSTMTAEQMDVVEDLVVGDPSLRENYNGIIFELAAGSGIITVDAKTVGTYVLNVQIGNSEPKKITQSVRGTVDVSYNVKEPTYVYIYASTEDGSAARLNRAPSAEANSVLLYGYKVNIDVTGIEGLKTSKVEGLKYYDLSGRRIDGKPTKKGVYIINGRKVLVK